MDERVLGRLRTLRVRDVMTRQVVTVSSNQSLDEVAELFQDNQLSAAPVVDARGKCVGILSSVDFLKAKPDRCQSAKQEQTHSTEVRRVGEYMSPHVVSIGPDELMLKAAHLMSGRHIHRIPVVGADGEIDGVISTMDIVSAMMNALDEAEADHFGATDVKT